MVLLIDNYDSFSYNLYQLIGEIEPDIRVIRNDEMTVSQIGELNPDRIILFGDRFPILGVCLGHQAICSAFGATVTYAKRLMHGKQSDARLDTQCQLFKGCPETAPVARYHSLAVDEDTLPDCLKVTAITEDGEVMGVRHADYPIFGVQFHPESILTPDGKTMLYNFIKGE